MDRSWMVIGAALILLGTGGYAWTRSSTETKVVTKKPAKEKAKGSKSHSIEPPWIIWGKQSNCRRIRQEHFPTDTRWLRFGKVYYSVPNGPELSYEMVERIPRRVVDGVDVIAVVKRRGRASKLLFVLNYRPPVDQVCVEFPSGLLDANETPQQAAVRELKEETGFTATRILSCSPTSYCDPWKSNETFVAVLVEVDGDDPINQQTTQNLESDENIQVLMVSLENTIFHSNEDRLLYEQSEEKTKRIQARNKVFSSSQESKTSVSVSSSTAEANTVVTTAKPTVGNASDSGYVTPLAHTIMTLCHSKGFAIEGKVLSFIQGLEFQSVLC